MLTQTPNELRLRAAMEEAEDALFAALIQESPGQTVWETRLGGQAPRDDDPSRVVRKAASSRRTPNEDAGFPDKNRRDPHKPGQSPALQKRGTGLKTRHYTDKAQAPAKKTSSPDAERDPCLQRASFVAMPAFGRQAPQDDDPPRG